MTFSSIQPRTSLLHLRTPSISSFYGDHHMGRLLPFGLYLGLFTFAHDFVVHPCRRYSRIKAAPTASLWASLPLGFILVLYPRVLQTLSSLSSSTPRSCSLSDDNPRRHRRSSTRSLKSMPSALLSFLLSKAHPQPLSTTASALASSRGLVSPSTRFRVRKPRASTS